MTRAAENEPDDLGFLTVLQHDQLGLVGGYLILNAAGRPLEFHCTAPVKPNRAQQILFGPTLHAYLYGEQIGQTLLGKSSSKPRAVFTNVERVLSVRDFVSQPVALVIVDHPAENSTTSEWRIETLPGISSIGDPFELGRNRLATAVGRDTDRQLLLKYAGELTAFDLAEPFDRIREAIEEAHKTSRAAA